MPKFKPLLQQGDDDEEEEEEVERIRCRDLPDCDPYEQGRIHFRAFDQGFTGDQYARNFTTCSYSILDWVYKEIATYKIKLHYGNYDNHVTNTTLFLKNTTTILHVCTDVVENIYYYALYEASKFEGFVDWTLAFL